MSLENIGIVYRKELREALRDRRTLISSLLVPLVLFPLLTAGLGAAISVLVGKAKEEIPKVMIIGGDDAPKLLEEIRSMKRIEVWPLAANWKDQIINKEIRAAVEIPAGFQADLAQHKIASVKIYNYDDDLKFSAAPDAIQKHLEEYRVKIIKENLAARNLPESALKPFDVAQQNVAPPEKVGGAAFGGVI